MKEDLISVIMSVYNEEVAWLKESIESILNQTYQNIEFIIIVDNPQNNALIDIIEDYSKKDIRIKFYINSENKGLIYSLNRAIDYCSGKYIARMDADDISHLNRFEKQLNYLIKNDLDLIGSNINLFKNQRDFFYTTNKLITHKYLKKMLSKGTIGIVHPTFFGKQEIFKKLKYNYSLHTEDKEFLARVFCNNYNVGNIRDTLLDCRYSNNSITKENAIYVNKIGRYVTKVFNNCLNTKGYIFDENYHKTLVISQAEIKNFSNKQKMMGMARESLNQRNYVHFAKNIFIAIYYSRSVFMSIKINLIFKLFKLLENIEIKGKVK